jgi:tetratricopeptide (TPR) repeat protein
VENVDGAFDASPGHSCDVTAREVADGLWLACQQMRAERLARGSADEPAVDADPPPPARDRPSVERRIPMVSGRRAEPKPDAWPVELPSTTIAPPSPWRNGHTGDMPARAPAAPLRPERPKRDIGLARALGPLKRTVPSRTERELDEEATAEWALTDERWLPIFRPADERRWDVLLIVDSSASMSLWWETAMAFGDTLARQGAFRNVQTRLLDLDRCTVSGTGPGAARRSPRELLDPSGRRIVLVLTDGCSPRWRAVAVLTMLREWAVAMPTALVHVMPWPTWPQTALEVHRLRLKATMPGVANSRLHWEPTVDLGLLDGDRRERSIPVPVLQLEPAWLRRWALLLAGRAFWSEIPALVLDPGSSPPAPTRDGHATPAMLVDDLRSTVSPLAFELATLFAAVPLNGVVIDRIRRELLPEASRSHIAELFASGLLIPVASREQLDDLGRETLTFDPAVRRELLASGRQAGTVRAMRVAQDCLAPFVPAFQGDGDVLDRTTDVDLVRVATAMTVPFLSARLAALEALSGRHVAAAVRLREQLAGIEPLSHPFGNSPTIPPMGAASLSDMAPASSLGSHRHPSVEPASPTGQHAPPGRAGGKQPVADEEIVTTTAGGVEVTTTGSRSQARETTAPVVWGGVPPRNPNFTGREELLAELHRSLVPGQTAAVVPHALQGMGGVGKSHLAIEYAYLHQPDFDVIWWVPAEHDVQIKTSLVELGERLNLGVGTEANVAVRIVLDALRGNTRWRVPPNWLLIFDNAESLEIVQPYLPTGGPGRILVTSRNHEWASYGRGLEVDVFRREESKQLLRRRGPELTDKEADQLAEWLGDLPLAIEQAAAYRAVTGMPAREYLELLAEKQDDLLNVSQATDYPEPVGAAWNLSLEQLRDRNPAALRMLQLAAMLAPDPIPRSLFFNGRGLTISPDLDRALRDRLRLNEAIREIGRYSLARIDHRTNNIQMHRLVRRVLENMMDDHDKQTMTHGAHLLLAASDPNAPAEPDEWSRYAGMYPHMTATGAIKCDDPGVRELVYNMAVYLFRWGDHRAARQLSQEIYDTWREDLGEDHRETLRIGRWLGFMLWSDGAYEEATALDNNLLGISRRVLGDDHEGTIEAMQNVAGDRRAQGEFASALELSQTIHTTALRAMGPEDPVALGGAHNLGVSLRLAGRFAEALELDRVTWRQKVEIYGADHTQSLITEVSITLDNRELGDYLGARRQHEDIVARFTNVHGAQHPQTLRAVRVLAEMRRKAGEHVGAMEAAKQAVAGLTGRYDELHPEAIAANLCLSIALRHASDFEDARQVGDETVQRYRSQLGDNHPHTLAAMVNQAVLLRLAGDPAAAKAVSEASVAGFAERIGAEHPSTLAATINLGNDLFALGDFAEALALDTTTHEVCARVFGPDHPTTLACVANLAQDLIATGSVAEGQRLHAQAVASLTERLGEQHPAVVEFSTTNQRANCDIDPLPL